MSQVQKPKKSYEEILEEARSMITKTAIVFVPKMCEALKIENPDFSHSDIQERIEHDCKGIWEPSTIYKALPSWIHDQRRVSAAKKIWEDRNAENVKVLEREFRRTATSPISEPKIPEPRTTYRPIVDEALDQDLHAAGLGKFGDSNRTIRELRGRITAAAADLFEALTDKSMAGDDEDLIVDYIKPSREFRRSLLNELTERDRTTIHNFLHCTSVAIDETIELIKEIDK